MKRVLLVVLVLATFILSSCQKESDPIFEKSADERVKANLKEYADLLASAKYGWKAEYFPGTLTAGGWSYIFKFKENGVVTTMADFNKSTATTGQDSHYRVASIHTPSLVFDSYSLLHILSDPNLGAQGRGYRGDFEFEIQRYKNDTLYLLGHYDNSILKLVKATEKEVNLEQRLARRAEMKAYFADISTRPYFKTLTVGSTKVDVSYNDAKKRLLFKYVVNDKVVTSARCMVFTDNGAVLSSPLYLPGVGKAITTIPFSATSTGDLEVNLAEYGAKASIAHSDFPAVPYLNGMHDIQIVNYLNVLTVSPSLKNLIAGIEEIPFFKDMQLLFNVADTKEKVTRSALMIYAPETSTLKHWYEYEIQWNYGKDGILTAKYLGTKSGATYEGTVKPFIDQICNGDGYTVLDVDIKPYGESTFYSFTLVSRGDSRDRITLYTFG